MPKARWLIVLRAATSGTSRVETGTNSPALTKAPRTARIPTLQLNPPTDEELMPASTQVPDDHPLMIAWEKYRATEEAENSDKWARTVKVSEPMQGQIILEHPHVVGSLWAAFSAGFAAAGGKFTV